MARKFPEVLCVRVEQATASDLGRLAQLSGRTVAQELRSLIRSRLLEAHLAGRFPGERPHRN